MTNPASVFQPAIDALEKDLMDLERKANGLLTSINVLRAKAGLPPRPGGWSGASKETGISGDHVGAVLTAIHSDTFLGKKMGSAAREYLEMRKASGGNAPATPREVFDALKQGGFVFGAKDDATAIVVLRAMLRKNTQMFYRLPNGTYGLRSWYPDLKRSKATESDAADAADAAEASEDTDDDSEKSGAVEDSEKPTTTKVA